MSASRPIHTHGPSGYNRGCRCEVCREASRTRTARMLRERKARVKTEGVPEEIPHGLSTASNWGCRCEVCKAALDARNTATRERAKAGALNHRGGSEPMCPCEHCRVAEVRKRAQRNAATLDTATHHGEEWTGPQVEIVASGRYTESELTQVLGRSLYAVKQAKRRLRDDPKFIRLAGLPEEA